MQSKLHLKAQKKMSNIVKASSHSHYIHFGHIAGMKTGHTWIYVEKGR